MAKTVRYTFSVYITVGCNEYGEPDYSGKELTCELKAVLRRVSGDTDYELMSTEEDNDWRLDE